jgi:hypothetical protein
MDKVPGARVNARTFVKNAIYSRSANARGLCYFIDRGSRFSPHSYEVNRLLSGSRYRIIMPQKYDFKRFL